MCFSLFQTGKYYVEITTDADGSEAPVWTKKLAPLEGRLAHIYYVKARRDISPREKKLHKFEIPVKPMELYHRFLIFKYFVASDRPVLVTEGKTDISYLKTAVKALREKFPALAYAKGDQIELNVRFLNSSTVNHEVLKLGSGFAGMTGAINSYEWWLKSYRFLPLAHPVIFIIDNDMGGKNVLKAASNVSKKDINTNSTDAFFRIQHNLYLVKTPLRTDGSLSAIEDCFPKELLKQAIGEKRLDLKKRHGDETNFGKHIFANQIVRPGIDGIDFSGFSPILEGISGAIIDYETIRIKAAERSAAKSA
jgi:hypothetical protein